MSINYYYESRECMLNFDTKLTPGVSAFFSNETENYNVDYFDNLCAIRKRDQGRRSTNNNLVGLAEYLLRLSIFRNFI